MSNWRDRIDSALAYDRMVWLAYWSTGDEDPPMFLGVAATEAGAWRLCEDTASRLEADHDDKFIGLRFNENGGERWAWAEFVGGIRSWRAFLVEQLPFFDESAA